MQNKYQIDFKKTTTILLILLCFLPLSNCNNKNTINRKVKKDTILLADREAPLGWVYLEIYNDSTFEFTTTGIRPSLKNTYKGRVNIKNDTLFFNYVDSIPKAGKTALFNDLVVGYIDGEYPEQLKIRFTKLINNNEKNQTIVKVLNLIENQNNVKKLLLEIDSISKGKRHLTFVPIVKDTAKNIYLVKVGEDNGSTIVTYFIFLVDAKTMTIINPSGKIEGQ